MEILLDAYKGSIEDLNGSCVAIGVFDGFHLGHLSLTCACIEDARARGCQSAIITFDKDPDELLKFGIEKIMSNEQRIEKLTETDIDAVLAIEFDDEVVQVEPIDFLDSIFRNDMPKCIHVGSDFRFGRCARGDIALLSDWCRENEVDLFVHELVKHDDVIVKSTKIRELLAKGEVEDANSLLGHPYEVCGKVVHGRGEGSSFGIATANVEADCILGDGVYAGYAFISNEKFKAAISVGIPPTFKDTAKDSLEAHILGYQGDLYGKDLRISFIKRIRPMIEFDSTDTLIAQIKQDISFVESNL